MCLSLNFRLFILYFCIAIFFHSCSKKKNTYPLLETDKHFTRVNSDHTRIKFNNTLTETSLENHIVNENFVTGAGVAIGDINNDGLPDIYFSGNQVEDKLYLNKGDLIFEDISKSSGIASFNSWSTGVTFADVNADGYQDIYVCKVSMNAKQTGENLLFLNNGDLTFTESAKTFRINDAGNSVQANFFDYNKDGLPDIYLINQPPGYGNRASGKSPLKHRNPKFSDKLYRNLGGNKGFVEISKIAKTNNLSHGLSASIGDLTNNNWPDIYVTNDYDKPDYIYKNNTKGAFENIAQSALKHMSNFSMGSDIADYDNDGFLDVFVVDMVAEDHKRIKTNMGGMNPEDFWAIVNNGWHYQYMFNTLQHNNGNSTFSDLAQIGGVSNTDWSWGPLMADFDNDGYKDIFVTNGIKRNMRFSDVNNKYKKILDSIEVEAKKQNKKFQDLIDVLKLAKMAPTDKLNNYIYKNNGDLTFENKIEEWGFNHASLSNGASYADLDLDGDLDLIVSNIDEEAFVYRNNTSERKKGNYLKVHLKSPNNANLYGSKVKLFKNDSLWQMIELTNNRGYMSKSDDIVHFGLGAIEKIEKIEIIWPNITSTILENINSNQLLVLTPKNLENSNNPKRNKTIFKDITTATKLSYSHIENNYNDFNKEVLLPHKMSEFGPYISVGDVNGDQLEDIFIGGSAGNPSSLFLQNTDGTFIEKTNQQWQKDKDYEDMGSTFFDIDNDGDLDLYVVSGGNEFSENSKLLSDRLYLNDGIGNFSKSHNRIPKNTISGSIVEKADYDNDGDIDLFIGGRLTPQKYPFPTSSKILENKNGILVDVTNTTLPSLNNIGLITSAKWVDIDKDKRLDLVIVGEWTPILTFINKGNKGFEEVTFEGLQNSNGWYYKVESADVDNDGDNDLVIGNLGLNYKYKANRNAPFQVHSYDHDKNGTNDIILSYYDHGQVYPIRGRSCSIEQIPSLKEKFPTFESFGDSNLSDIYGNALNNALNLKAFTFSSYYAENINGKDFVLHQLPNLAQVSSINNILIKDFDSDNALDILISGNLYGSEIETPRNDAGIGLFLKGNGKGQFNPIHLNQSGFYAPNDAKDMKSLKIGNRNAVIIGNNKAQLQLLAY
ncbi:VCBS repeat-containing protein [Seonamhaeicola marinus]|uniref:VCBS repeat-containing protein n=1 Tax=Seonamhaeicola marinus TaxID=1912246 RepID=A0A5D0IK66_9FLAO|nr:VCBS repeat-containing protein [Seonamhaeicola marinus]TYA84175.1 VCBS repeat-containing protein [Seonamhaeicola marinus]